jgi:predicted aspartyl protease
MKCLALLLLLCTSLIAHAQQRDSTESAAVLWANERRLPDPEPILSESHYVLPFTMAGRLMLIEATIDTFTGNFILDTGAPHLVLNKSWFRAYGTQAYASAGGGVTGQINEVFGAQVRQLNIGKIRYNQVEADVIELSHIEKSRGVPILGLLGVNLFKSFEMFIDYNAQVIHLYALDKKGKRLKSSEKPLSVKATIPFLLYNNTILVDGSINKVPMRYCLDTGAEVNVLHNRLPKKAMESVNINSRALLTGAGGQKIEVLKGIVPKMLLGTYEITEPTVLITHLGNMSRAYNLRIDAMLGYDFLSLAPFSINFVTNQLIIWESKEVQGE